MLKGTIRDVRHSSAHMSSKDEGLEEMLRARAPESDRVNYSLRMVEGRGDNKDLSKTVHFMQFGKPHIILGQRPQLSILTHHHICANKHNTLRKDCKEY